MASTINILYAIFICEACWKKKTYANNPHSFEEFQDNIMHVISAVSI
jgi:hypothetical protein